MAKKMGLTKMEIVRFHKLLRQGRSMLYISRMFKTTVKVLKGLTPDKIAAADKRAKNREKGFQKQKIANQQAADVLSATAAKVMMGGAAADPIIPASPKPATDKAPDKPGTPKFVGTPTGTTPPAI